MCPHSGSAQNKQLKQKQHSTAMNYVLLLNRIYRIPGDKTKIFYEFKSVHLYSYGNATKWMHVYIGSNVLIILFIHIGSIDVVTMEK